MITLTQGELFVRSGGWLFKVTAIFPNNDIGRAAANDYCAEKDENVASESEGYIFVAKIVAEKRNVKLSKSDYS